MDTTKGVMNSVKDSVSQTIVNELNTLTNLDLRLTILDWEANAEVKVLNSIEQMILDLAKLVINVRESNNVLKIGA
jgi:hypothetical protein